MANPFSDATQPQTPSPDDSGDQMVSLPRDPVTGSAMLSMGPGTTSNIQSQGQDTSPAVDTSTTAQAPTQVAQNDQRGPRYDPNIVDDSGLPVDLWANGRANASGSQPSVPVQSNTTNTAPGEPAGVSPTGEQAPDPNDDLDAIQQSAVRSTMATDKRIGSPMNIVKAINEDVLDGLRTQNGVNPSDPALVSRVLNGIGLKFMSDPNAKSVDPQELFDSLGIDYHTVPGYMTDAGHQVWSTLATSLAMGYGASALAVKAGIPAAGVASRAIGLAAQKYSAAIASNPGTWLATELMGGVGATVGGEESQDYAQTRGAGKIGANLLGSMGGALAGAGSAFLTLKTGAGVMRISKYVARGIAEAVSEVSHLFGGNTIGSIPSIGRKGAAPIVDQDILDTARTKETAARDAGDAVVDARKYRDAQVPNTSEHTTAGLALAQAKSTEDAAVREAESAWNMVPAEVRGPWSRQQSAIRAKFADTEYPKQFAEQQVEGEKRMIGEKVKDIFKGLEPEEKRHGVAGYSVKVANGLWEVRRMAKGILGKYWDRAPLQETIPNRGNTIRSALNEYLTDLKTKYNYTESQIPLKDIEDLMDKFGSIQSAQPKLGWLKNFMTELDEKANKAYLAGDTSLGSNYDRLHDKLWGVIATAFPDNVPLQQARSVSHAYFDLFARSDLGQVFRGNRARGTAIHEEDVLPKLMDKARGMEDISKAVSWLENHDYMHVQEEGQAPKLTPDDRAKLSALQNDAAQGIRASVTEYIQKFESDPTKAQRMLGDPAFQSRIQAFGKVAGQVRQAASDLTDVIKRNDDLERSALSKYAQRDADKALDMVWSGTNPSAMAKALMDGTAGVGGFRQDPIAMQGFKAGLLDRFYNTSKGDPAAMRRLLESARGRLLKTVLSSGEYTRLDGLIGRIESISAEQANRAKGAKFKTFLAQMLALKALHWMPEWMNVGEGGELKRASLISGLAKDAVEHFYEAVPPEKMLSKALENPEFEAMLYRKPPTSSQEAIDTMKAMRRISAFERGIYGFFGNWMTYGDGPGPHAQAETTDQPLAGLLGISPANAGEVVPFKGANNYGVPGMVGDTPEAMVDSLLKTKTQGTLSRALGVNAKVLPMTPDRP